MDAERTDRLRHLLGGAELARLRGRIRDHLAAGGDPDGVVSLAEPTPHERQAVAALLGTQVSTARRLRLPLTRLTEGLQGAGLADTLTQALEVVDGPIPDRMAARQADEAAWAEVLAAAAELDRSVPWLDGWAVDIATSGRLKRAAGSDAPMALDLLDQLGRVLRRLPVDGSTRRARLANEALGAAHALDAGTPLAGLALDAVRELVGPPQLAGSEGARESWAGVGVLWDDLTSRVCVLNLPAHGHGPVDRLLRAAPGQPVWLTLRMLVADPPTLAGGRWFICENLSVIAEAADALGPACPPLVCVAGNPVVAVVRLLDLLVAAGAQAGYHGDFDWPGVAIAGRVLDRLGGAGHPWRFDAPAYRQVVARRADELPRLAGGPVDTPWDEPLARSMAQAGVAVEEEAVLDVLLADLAARSGFDRAQAGN